MMIDINLKNKNTHFYSNQYKYIAGVDEVGRGPLVGPVVAAAVILPTTYDIPHLTDSKKLTPKRREVAYEAIKEQALAYAIARVDAKEIDQINILQASLKAMAMAVAKLKLAPEVVLVDGNAIPKNINGLVKPVIKGDLYEDVISAAAIIAKVSRDREMVDLDLRHPEYGFAKHKGYPTKAHLQAIENHGVIDQHRRSFAPVKNFVQ